MTNEDKTASVLKGHNCFIKFIDGEELTIYVEELAGDIDSRVSWFADVELFINNNNIESRYFPVADISLSSKHIKYVKYIK